MEDPVEDYDIEQALTAWQWDCSIDEGRLMLAELLLKASAGYLSSNTEEGFLRDLKLLKNDRTPNKTGRQFLCSMFYKHSNLRPKAFYLMSQYRDE